MKANREDPEGRARSRSGPVLVIGPLQSGKTTLFARLCGERFPDMAMPMTSVEATSGFLVRAKRHALWDRLRGRRFPGGRSGGAELLDTPGTATLFPEGQDESIARDALLDRGPRAILVVADARNLRRSLALVAHAAEFELPLVVAVNMEDEAWRRGVSIDSGLLESAIGADVVLTSATAGAGVDALAARLRDPRVPRRLAAFPRQIERSIERLVGALGGSGEATRGLATLLLAKDEAALRHVAATHGEEALERTLAILEEEAAPGAGNPPQLAVTEALHAAAGGLAAQVVSHSRGGWRALDAFGRAAHHPILGVLIAALVVSAAYLWIGSLGATRVVDWLSAHVFEGWLNPLATRWAAHLPWPIVRDALVDPEFGLVPTGVSLAFGLVMPVLAFFYFAFNILIDSGYLPRLSVLFDRVFRLIGLNGKGILPLTMGFSCVTMALITTRVLDTKRERIIASLLLMLGTPCAPLLAMMLVILGQMPVSAAATVFGVIVTQTALAGFAAGRLLEGRPADFILAIPPMRRPRLRRALARTFRQTYHFMKEAVPLFLLASLVVFAVNRFGALAALERAAHPVVNGLLGLPDEAIRVFMKTLIRRESGAAELELAHGGFDGVQLVVTMLVMSFLMPCVNSAIVLVKERGVPTAFAMIGLVSIYALAVGAAVNAACRALGVTFS
jgi:ferrous iron transport protein B